MTVDSRQQAKQIVDALYDNWKRLPSHPAVTEEQLEQALAATIEYRWAKHAMDRATARGDIEANEAAWNRACEAGPRLDEALSALGVEVAACGLTAATQPRRTTMSETEGCETCRGTGEYLYGETSMGMGPGGQGFTVRPCPGTRHRPDLTDCPVVLAMVAERGVWKPHDTEEDDE